MGNPNSTMFWVISYSFYITFLRIQFKRMKYHQLKWLPSLVLLIILGFSACKKADLDLNKYQDVKLQPGIVTPLASVSITAGKILKQDSIIVHDPDGLIRFVVRKDSIVTIGADSILRNISLPKSNVNFTLGEIDVPAIKQTQMVTLQDLVNVSDAQTQQVFNYYNGKDTIFPALSSPAGDTNAVAKPTNYEFIHISKGYLRFTLTNNFPTVLFPAEIPPVIANFFNFSKPPNFFQLKCRL